MAIHPDQLPFRRSLWLLGLAFCALVLLMGWFLLLGQQIVAAETRQAQLGVSLLKLRVLLSDMQDAEIGQRGYLLSGKDEFLAPYLAATRNIEVRVGEVRDALRAHGLANARLERVVTLARQRMDGLAQAIRLAQAGSLEQAIVMLRQGGSAQQMDRFRLELHGLMDQVRDERKEIGARITVEVRQASLLLLAICLSITLMVALAAGVLIRALKQNAALMQRLEDEATHDGLTGLPNRRLLFEWLEKVIGEAQRRHSSVAVFFVDLDGFKQINDKLGHAAGDVVLKTVATRFGTVLRNADLIARFGGDEFAVVVSESASHEHLASLAQRLVDALAPPMAAEVAAYPVGASIGIAVYPQHGADVATLIKAADGAMYIAKQAGKGCFQFAAVDAR